MWTSIFLAVCICLVLHHWQRRRRLGVPGPLGLPIVGSLFDMMKQNRVYDYFMDNTIKYGSPWGMLLGPQEIIVVADPESCEHVLKKNWKNYERGPKMAKSFGDLLGKGIFVSNGSEWKLHRHLAKPLFRSESIDRAMVPIFIEHTQELIHNLNEAAKRRESVDLVTEFMQLTMNAFLTLGLGCTDTMLPREKRAAFAKAFDYLQLQTNLRGMNPFWEYFVPKECKENLQLLDDTVYSIVEQRKKEDLETLQSKTDIFSQFLLLKDDENKPLSDKYLRDVFMNFLLAGRDTTAVLLAWTCYELTRNPQIKEKVLKEVNEVVKGDEPTPEEVHNLVYTKQMLTEVLRLHPSLPVDGREAVEEDTLPSGHKINKGAAVLYSPYVMGRLEKLYENPLKFDPDRWSPANQKKVLPGQFTAFHLGPQTCLGKEMAYVEARVVLSMILKKGFEFSLPDPTSQSEKEKGYQLGLFLLPKEGLRMIPSVKA